MSTAETITTKIHETADAELKKKISEAFSTFKMAIGQLGVSLYHVHTPLSSSYVRDANRELVFSNTKVERVFVQTDEVLGGMCQHAVFESGRDQYRTKAVEAYMRRIEELERQNEQLAQEIRELAHQQSQQ